LDRLKN
jgi:phage-related minor tail protein